MPQYEFRQICDTKLESIRRRISSYQQVLEPLGRGFADVRGGGGVGILVSDAVERNKRCAVFPSYYHLNVVQQHTVLFFWFVPSLPLALAVVVTSKSCTTDAACVLQHQILAGSLRIVIHSQGVSVFTSCFFGGVSV